ncbi:protein LURP-one-related 10-like [Pistacia vera]|uniref:protein LURP-one-related 10-like n=1 Tax=Pistacia vera TaxID=55513 RepID=UPI0012631EA1|nr:protein LURP-one-related 10-like [Pistacia vera]
MAHFTGTTNPPTDIYPPPPPPPPQAVVANSVSIIGPQFCGHTYPIDLAIVRKVLTITDGNFVVQDINGNVLFKVKGTLLTVHDRRVLLDSTGNPIVTLRRKIMTAHDRWQVFRGESTELSDLIFTAKRSSMFQLKTKLDVFLANNTKEDVCDFKIKGSWLERSCVIYAGESSTVVAQMHKKHTAESILLGKDKFMVTVYPNIDYAFIVSLIVILDAINTESGGGSGGGSDILSGVEF